MSHDDADNEPIHLAPLNLARTHVDDQGRWLAPFVAIVVHQARGERLLATLLDGCQHHFGAAFLFGMCHVYDEYLAAAYRQDCADERHLRSVLQFQQWADGARSPAMAPLHTLVVIQEWDRWRVNQVPDALVKALYTHPRITLVWMTDSITHLPCMARQDADIVMTCAPVSKLRTHAYSHVFQHCRLSLDKVLEAQLHCSTHWKYLVRTRHTSQKDGARHDYLGCISATGCRPSAPLVLETQATWPTDAVHQDLLEGSRHQVARASILSPEHIVWLHRCNLLARAPNAKEAQCIDMWQQRADALLQLLLAHTPLARVLCKLVVGLE
jgi:hypothetical protein